MSNIEGLWSSRYEYGQGPDDQPQASEHQIRFERVDDAWVGTSLPTDNGSSVTLNLEQDGNSFSGKWQEHTSPTGHYKGREFKGLILLTLQDDGLELNGMWLGPSSSNRVKTGAWVLRREVAEA